MMKRLKILIVNDDGIRSEGIAHLARAAAQFGSVWVAAPERQCSGMSVRLTISETSEMAVYRYDFPAPVEAAWSVDGTPADCVKVALRALLPFTPDVVLSGINDGMNAGLDLRDRVPEQQSYYENYYHCVREENGVQYLSPKATVLRPDEVTDGSDIQAVLNGFVSIGKVRCAAF